VEVKVGQRTGETSAAIIQLLKSRGPMTERSIAHHLGKKHIRTPLNRMLQSGVLRVFDDVVDEPEVPAKHRRNVAQHFEAVRDYVPPRPKGVVVYGPSRLRAFASILRRHGFVVTEP
jgi:hypothetical protein